MAGLRVVSGTLFFPRGGSAFVVRALARGMRDRGVAVTIVSGSRHDGDALGDARTFYAGLDLHEVDFTPALHSPDPMRFAGPPGTAPMQPSFEHRAGAPDLWMAALDDELYERQVEAWARELRAAGADRADVLHLHHLTPLHAAAQRVAPHVPVVAHLHGTELLLLEELDEEGADRSPWGPAWRRRLRAWARQSARLVVAPGNRARAVELLGERAQQAASLPNGFDPAAFHPRAVDRGALWRRTLVDAPRGWRPGGAPGSVRYDASVVDALARGPVVLYVGRFTAVKRLPLLLEAFAAARARTTVPATLVVVGGHPGEWEGEHPAQTIERLGCRDVLLAGWHDHTELPELLAAADLLVLPSARESFGMVLVEAMACGVPPIAAASLGPASIVEDGETGWLFGLDDREALAAALVEAIDRPDERARRARRAERVAHERFAWPAIAGRLAGVLEDAAATASAAD